MGKKRARYDEPSSGFGDKIRKVMDIISYYYGIYLVWYRSKKFKIPSIILLPVHFLWMELVLRAYSGKGIFSHFFYTLVFSLSIGFFLWAVISFICRIPLIRRKRLRQKLNRTLNLIILWASAFYYVVECMIKYTFQVYMSFDSMGGGAGNVFKEYRSELFTAVVHGVPRFVIFALPAIFYLATGRRRMPAPKRKMPRPVCGVVLAFSLILLGMGVIGGTFGKYSEIYRGKMAYDSIVEDFGLFTATRLNFEYNLSGGSGSDGFDITTTTTDTDSESGDSTGESGAATETTAVNFDNYAKEEMTTLDLDSLINGSDSDVAEVSTYVKSLTPTSQNAYTGLFKGKNLIVLCLEAFSDVVIDENMTPTLYRLQHNGIYFSEYYQPAWGGSTSTGEFSELMGIVPVKGVKSMTATADCNNYFTIGNALQRENYWSAAFHAGNYTVYSRDKTHTNLGYGEYLGRGNGLENINGGDSTDTATLSTTFDYYVNNQPFSVYCMTLSGHCIYQEGSKYVTKYYDKLKAYYGDKYKDTTLYYLCYQQELENAVTELLAKIEAAGIADNTVLCMTADHYPYGLEKSSTFKTDEDYLADLYGAAFEHPWERDHNAWILWSGCLENENKNMACQISTPTYSLDICPTLLNLFGCEWDSRLLVGRDVFSDADPLCIWNGYTWVTEKGKYDASEGTFYPNEGYEDLDQDTYVSEMKSIVKNKMNYSGQVIALDYFGKLFGEDTITDNSHYVSNGAAKVDVSSVTAATTESSATTDGTTTTETSASDSNEDAAADDAEAEEENEEDLDAAGGA